MKALKAVPGVTVLLYAMCSSHSLKAEGGWSLSQTCLQAKELSNISRCLETKSRSTSTGPPFQDESMHFLVFKATSCLPRELLLEEAPV